MTSAPLPEPASDPRLPVTPWQPIPALGAAIAMFAASLLIAWGVTTTFGELFGLQTVTSTPISSGGSHGKDAIYLVFGFMLVAQLALVVLVWLAAGIRRSHPAKVLQLGPPRGGLRIVLVNFLVMATGLALFNAVAYWVSPGSILGDLQPFVGMIRSDLWWLVALVVVVGAPLSEELLVRGFLLPALAWSPLGYWGAAAVSSFSGASSTTATR